MKPADKRTLNALGYSIMERLKFPGLRVYAGSWSRSRPVLLVGGSRFGITWASVAHLLSENQFNFEIPPVGQVWLVVEDNYRVRKFLETVQDLSVLSARTQVHITQVGFLDSAIKPKFEWRALAAPLTILIFLGGVWAWSTHEPIDAQKQVEKESVISCALDLDQSSLADWLLSELQNVQLKQGQTTLKTEQGNLDLTITNQIGSTQSVAGHLVCLDGRNKTLQFRIDKSNSGSLIFLTDLLDP